MIKLFGKEQSSKRNIRELLRNNLNVIEADMFYIDDPMNSLENEQRTLYLKTFFDLYKDSKLIDRIKFHINKQAQKTLSNFKDGESDLAGAMNINGMAFIMNDIERIANMYIKETTAKAEPKIDKFKIIPEVG